MIFSNFAPALLTAGVPLFLLSFALVTWALYQGRLTGRSVKEVQGSIESLSKAQKNNKDKSTIDPALAKWFRFGGGFYGSVALYTWLLIEWDDAASFLLGIGDILFDFSVAAVISLVIEFFVESLVNFVVAIAWPAYWLAESRDAWVMLFVAYAGYWLGINVAQYAWHRGWVTHVVSLVAQRIRRE